ncbi:hypothetical protein SESBI_42896 [Sesbania bispinosa]|nr:hypothetical protein SESBI_42896 [Sesbania bispinosa]
MVFTRLPYLRASSSVVRLRPNVTRFWSCDKGFIMRVTSKSRREEYFHRGDLHLLERILLLTASSIEREEMMQHNTSSGSWLIRSSSSQLFFIPFTALFVVGLDIVFFCREKALKRLDSKIKWMAWV